MGDIGKILQALQFPNGDYLIVSDSGAGLPPRSHRLFSGATLDNLQKIAVIRANKFRDGGTTHYQTNTGTLVIPEPQHVQDVTWRGEHETITLTKLNVDEISQKLVNPSEDVATHDPKRNDGQSWADASSDRTGNKLS